MIPAIYHLEVKVITRGVGRSAVAASAYMSCSEITNEYNGVKHDYTRKGGLVYEKIFLPSHAPSEPEPESEPDEPSVIQTFVTRLKSIIQTILSFFRKIFR